MRLSNFFNILISTLFLLAFIGIPVTKSYCSMEYCIKECATRCCAPDSEDNSCNEKSEYIKLDADFAYQNASIKLPDISLLIDHTFNFLQKTVAVPDNRHSEYSYINPSIPVDIPVKVRCFRI